MSELPCNASVLVYGASKLGKTCLVSSGPPPVLLLDAEGGSRFLPFRKKIWSNPLMEPPSMDDADVCIVYVRDFGTLTSVYQWLHSGKHPFRTVAVDSISEAQQRCVDAIAGQKQMTQPDWGSLLRQISSLVRSFRDLLIHPINPLDCIAFTAMDRADNNGVHSPYLQGAIASVLSYYLDIVLYYGLSPGADGQPARKLLSKPHPMFLAGDRTGRLPNVIEVPHTPTTENPVLSHILDMACDLERPVQMDDVAAFPDLSTNAADDLGADAPDDTPTNTQETKV